MASTERSLGWATSGTGDGPAGGYDSTRWRANAQKSDGNGITLFGSDMAMSGATTSTLTIADGACIINGYTYETNGSVTISTTGLTGTYSIVLVANNSAGTVTVTQTGAGGTTIAASTVRAAIATSAQVTTITTAVGAANVITLGSTTIAAGVISTITQSYPFAVSMQLPAQVYATMSGLASSASIANLSYTTLTNWFSSSTSGEGLITPNLTTGEFTIALAGVYLMRLITTWDSNTAGSRVLQFSGTGIIDSLEYEGYSQLATNLALSASMQYSNVLTVNAGAVVKSIVYQNSGGTRTIGNAQLKIVRV